MSPERLLWLALSHACVNSRGLRRVTRVLALTGGDPHAAMRVAVDDPAAAQADAEKTAAGLPAGVQLLTRNDPGWPALLDEIADPPPALFVQGDLEEGDDPAVAEIISNSGVDTGTAQVFNVGSTGAIGTIEFEPGLEQDLPDILDKLMPPSREYGHEKAWHDGNGHSHLQATTLGPSVSVPVSGGRPVLGTWQQIFHLECDVKPRQRTIVVTVVGE